MTIGSGANVQITYQEESTRGTSPASPDMTLLRTTGRNINLNKNILESAEVRGSRQKLDVRHGFNSVVGSIPFELSRANYDSWLYYLLGDNNATDATPGPLAWNNVAQLDTVVSIDKTGAAAGQCNINRSTGSFITDNYYVGMTVQTLGFAANNNVSAFVVSLTATDLTVADPNDAMTDEVAGAGKTIEAMGYIESGSVLKALTIERGFTDIAQYQLFNGVAVNQLTLSIQPEAIINGTWDLIGIKGNPWSGTSFDATPNAATASSPYDAFTGALMEGGSIVAFVTGLELTITNNRSVVGIVGQNYSPDVFEGQHIVTGTLTAFFQDATQINKFVNETPSNLSVRLDDPNGTDYHTITIPNVKYTGGEIDPPAEGPVPITMPFQGLENTPTGTHAAASIIWQASNQ